MKPLVLYMSLTCMLTLFGCQDTNQETQEVSAPIAQQRGPKVDVKASVNSPQVDIGARVKYRVEVKFRKGVEIDWPPVLEQLDHQVVFDIGIWTEEDPVGNYRVRSMQVELDPGIDEILTIPATKIRWRESEQQDWVEATTDEITVEVLSVSDGAFELQEPLDSFDLPKTEKAQGKEDHTRVLALAGGSVLALGILAFFLLRRRRLKAVPALSAEEIANQELDHLDSLDLLGKGRVKEFYYRLTAIIRRYIELRFGITAPDQTTEEFLSRMKTDDRLSADDKEVLESFLQTADLVRYAQHEPPIAEVQSAMIMARGFVDRLPVVAKEKEVAHAV